MDDPVWTVAVDGLKESVKSGPGGVVFVPDSLLLPPPQPAGIIAKRMNGIKAILRRNLNMGNQPSAVSMLSCHCMPTQAAVKAAKNQIGHQIDGREFTSHRLAKAFQNDIDDSVPQD
jgi:hypothetical protein